MGTIAGFIQRAETRIYTNKIFTIILLEVVAFREGQSIVSPRFHEIETPISKLRLKVNQLALRDINLVLIGQLNTVGKCLVRMEGGPRLEFNELSHKIYNNHTPSFLHGRNLGD